METAETHQAADQPIWSYIRELGVAMETQLNWVNEATNCEHNEMSLAINYGDFSAHSLAQGGHQDVMRTKERESDRFNTYIYLFIIFILELSNNCSILGVLMIVA